MEQANIKPVTLVIGRSGVGKTTIAKSIFGSDIIDDNPSDEIKKYESENMALYDSLKVNISKGDDYFIDEIQNYMYENYKIKDESAHINTFCYVIEGSGGRVTDSDLKIINTLPSECTIIIISKADISKPQQLDVRIKTSGLLLKIKRTEQPSQQ